MNKNYPPILFFFIMSFFLMASSENWFSSWMILELNTLTFISFLMFNNLNMKMESCLSYYLIQTMSSLILLLSLSSSYLYKMISNVSMFFLSAMSLKLALAPMHLWLVFIAMNSSWISLFVLTTIQKILPIMLLEMLTPEISNLLIFILLSSILLGSISNLSSSSLKMILIFSSISNMGWLFLALLISSSLWKMFLLIYSLLIFFILTEKSKKTKEYNKMSSIVTLLSLLSIGGIPPLMGFFPKILILNFSLKTNNLFLSSIIILLSILDIFIYTRISITPFFSKMKTVNWKKMSQKTNNRIIWLIIISFIISVMMTN